MLKRFLLVTKYMSFVFLTCRWQFLGEEYPKKYWDNDRPFIVCFWHGRLLMTCFAWRSSRPFYMLISAHKDGQIIANGVRSRGFRTITGSTTKGGVEALRTIIKLLKEHNTIGITPDGPQGPRFQVSAGIAKIARLSGRDVIPVTFSTSRRIILKSWDRFVLALPFSRAVMAWGPPIKAPARGKSNLEDMRQRIENSLNEICDRVDAQCGQDPIGGAAQK
jgi:lysophospholipid acyltransferase (LPLAT)-like uncharacterized protein